MARRPVTYRSTRAFRQPLANLTGRAQARPVSTALLLFGLVLLIVWLRNGRQLPDRQRTLALLVGAAVVTASASVAPEFVTALLLATLVVVAIDQQAVVVDAIRRVQAMLTGSGGSAATPAPGNTVGLRPI